MPSSIAHGRNKAPPRRGFWIAMALLLLAEILMAGAAGLANRADRGFLGSLIAAPGNGDQCLNRLLEVVLGLLELRGLAPDCRQGRGFYGHVLGALGEAV